MTSAPETSRPVDGPPAVNTVGRPEDAKKEGTSILLLYTIILLYYILFKYLSLQQLQLK